MSEPIIGDWKLQPTDGKYDTQPGDRIQFRRGMYRIIRYAPPGEAPEPDYRDGRQSAVKARDAIRALNEARNRIARLEEALREARAEAARYKTRWEDRVLASDGEVEE